MPRPCQTDLLLLLLPVTVVTQVGSFPGMLATPAEWANNILLKLRLTSEVITCHYADPDTMLAIYGLLAGQLAEAGATANITAVTTVTAAVGATPAAVITAAAAVGAVTVTAETAAVGEVTLM